MSYSQRVEILKKRGVPESFIDAIARKKQGHVFYAYALFVWMVAYIMSMFPLFDFYHGMMLALYAFPANKSDLFLPSPVAETTARLFLALLGLSLPVWGVVTYFLRPGRDGVLNDKVLYKAAVTLRTLALGEDMLSVRLNPKFPVLANLPSADAFISAACGASAVDAKPERDLARRRLAMTFFIQCIVTLLAVVWMHFSYANIFGNTIEFSTLFSDVKLPLSQIASVATSCVSAATKSSPDAHHGHYVVRTGRGQADLFDSEKLGTAQNFSANLEQIEAYDRYLRSTGVDIKKISAEEAQPCVSYWSKGHPEVKAPILRLLTER